MNQDYGNNGKGEDLGIKLEPLSLSEFEKGGVREHANSQGLPEFCSSSVPKSSNGMDSIEASLVSTTQEQLEAKNKNGLAMYAVQAKLVMEWSKGQRETAQQEIVRLRQENSTLRQQLGYAGGGAGVLMQFGGGGGPNAPATNQAPPQPPDGGGGWQ